MTPERPAARTIVPSQSIRCRVVTCRERKAVAITASATSAERQVDVEDPAPGEVVDEEAAEQRTGDDGDAEHAAEQALVAAAVARRDEVADDGHRHDEQAAAAEPLDALNAISCGMRLRQPAERRADEEERRARTGGRACGRRDRRASRTAARPPSTRAGTRSRPTRGARGRRGRRRSSAARSTRSSGRAPR